MPIDFSKLPFLFQRNITEKLDFEDYVEYELASKHSNSVAKAIKSNITITDSDEKFVGIGYDDMHEGIYFDTNLHPNVIRVSEKTQIRFDGANMSIEYYISNVLCKTITRFLLETNSTAISVDVHPMAEMCCSPEIFNDFLEATRATTLTDEHRRRHDLTNVFFQTAAFRKLRSIHSENAAGLDDETFLGLSAENIYITNCNLTSQGINLFIKECISGKRNVEKVVLGIRMGIVEIADDLQYKFSKRINDNGEILMSYYVGEGDKWVEVRISHRIFIFPHKL